MGAWLGFWHQKDARNLLVFERKMLKMIYDPVQLKVITVSE